LNLKLKPGKRKEVKFMKECIRSIRKIGKNQILERLNDIKNQNYIPIDILSTILNNWSKCSIKKYLISLINILKVTKLKRIMTWIWRQ
jgi:hypothetical protein